MFSQDQEQGIISMDGRQEIPHQRRIAKIKLSVNRKIIRKEAEGRGGNLHTPKFKLFTEGEVNIVEKSPQSSLRRIIVLV